MTYKEPYKNQVIWIIGASSGIGFALGKLLAKQGAILALSSRRASQLEKLQSLIGTQHKLFPFDISDKSSTLNAAKSVQSTFSQIDRVILLAASYQPMELDCLNIEKVDEIIDVNLKGAFNLIHTVVPLLKNQQVESQIALCGSVAGYIGLPYGQPYSATKAAIINLAESLYVECYGKIDIKLISPGFVRTELTSKNTFQMPMIISAERAAEHITKGLRSRPFEIHFPKRFTFILKTLSLLPYFLLLRLLRKIER